MAKNKSAIRTPKMLDEKYLGPEPTFVPALVENDSRLIRAYSWYNYFFTVEDGRKWTVAYMKANKFSKADIAKVQKAPTHKFSMTACNLSKIANNGNALPAKHQAFLDRKLSILLAEDAVVEVEKVAITKNVLTIRQKVQRIVDATLADLEDEIDIFVNNGYEGAYNVSKYYADRQIKPANLTNVITYYTKLADELSLLVKGNKDVVEGYSITKAEAKRFLAFVKTIIDDTNVYCSKVKKPRKVSLRRQKKAKSATQLTSKMKYMDSVPGTSIVGLNPINVVGAKSVWVYYPKYRLLGVYHSVDENGFGAKRTSLTNYDPDTAIKKKVRKPDVVLKEVVDGGKVQLRKLMDSIKAKPAALNGRFTKDTVIIRIIK